MKKVAIVLILLVVFALSGYMLTTQISTPVSSPPVPAATPTPETALTPTTSSPAPIKPAASSTPAVAPAPVVPAAPAEKAATSAASLTVSRIVIANAVEDRKPVGISASFPASQAKVYCYLDLSDVTKDQRITYAWSSGGETGNVTQQIRKSPRWRTWSVKPLNGKKADWKVDILDESGNVLASATFKVE